MRINVYDPEAHTWQSSDKEKKEKEKNDKEIKRKKVIETFKRMDQLLLLKQMCLL